MLSNALTDQDIAKVARDLRMDMWDHQVKLWPGLQVNSLDASDPWVAARHLGYEVQEGWLNHRETRVGFQLGGFINRPAKLIGLSDQQKPKTMRFTLAHEIGHLLLHEGIQHHRERAIHGITEPSAPLDPREREANHFAGCYLVPSKPLRMAFEECFGVEQLTLTDDVAFQLLGEEYMSLLNQPYEVLVFERLVAQATRFRGRHFGSLCDLFQVSATTLAIRLRQVGLTRR
jgi:hypothetical protein